MTDSTAALRAGLGAIGNGFGRIVATFHEAVGPDIARVATPTSLRAGTLTIRCTSAAWAQTVSMMELDMLDRLAQRLGPGTVTRIVARAGGPAPTPRPDPPQRTLDPIDEQEAARLAKLVAPIPDPALRARMLAAATAAARRRAASRDARS
jgi:hypothetical protein